MNINKFQNIEMPIEDDVNQLHNQMLSFNSLWPTYTLNPPTHLLPSTSTTTLHDPRPIDEEEDLEQEPEEEEELGPTKELMYRIAAMQPVDIDPTTIKKPKRRNVRISDDPQSVAARLRREKISEKIRILQRLVPGGTKMDTASMLEEAIRYVKFLKRQIRILQSSNQPQVQLQPSPQQQQQQQQQPALGDQSWELEPYKYFSGGTSTEVTSHVFRRFS